MMSILGYVIYSRTIASIANVFCWLYPTLNKVYLILSLGMQFQWDIMAAFIHWSGMFLSIVIPFEPRI